MRRKYKLDAVVSGSASETEQLTRLRDWVSRQWKYQPPAVYYPAWDADEILRRKSGFCVQYAVVLMQTAISLGHQARFVFGDNPGGSYEAGHEVTEIWSNEHRKWIFLDGNVSLHYIDPKTKVADEHLGTARPAGEDLLPGPAGHAGQSPAGAAAFGRGRDLLRRAA